MQTGGASRGACGRTFRAALLHMRPRRDAWRVHISFCGRYAVMADMLSFVQPRSDVAMARSPWGDISEDRAMYMNGARMPNGDAVGRGMSGHANMYGSNPWRRHGNARMHGVATACQDARTRHDMPGGEVSSIHQSMRHVVVIEPTQS